PPASSPQAKALYEEMRGKLDFDPRANLSRRCMAGVTHRLEAHVLGEGDWIGATEICRLCWLDLGAVMELAELGVVAPRGTPPGEWQIPATALPRLRVIGRLMRDLGVN